MSRSKRALTEETHAANTSTSDARNDGLSAELTACLQNVGSRVRRCVDQGYATHRYSAPTTPHSSPEKPKSTSTENTLFSSATDILNDVFASPLTTSPLGQSPTKRGRTECEDEDLDNFVTDEDGDTTMRMPGALEGEQDDCGIRTTRPVRPLRSPRRRPNQTVSLPTGLLFASQSPHDQLGNVKVEEGERTGVTSN